MQPLANLIRPDTLDDFVGQTHLVGAGKPLRNAIEQGHVFSFVLWGTPGVGKTTLARMYAGAIHADFHELSAVSAGKEDIRKIIKSPTEEGRPKVLFLDEIHRFNKAQQDFLLPFVESGELVLIGATTENPSFEIIPALLSRLRVFVLNELAPDEMRQIIDRTGFELDDEAKNWLIELANGDARQAITMIENTARLYENVVNVET
jgi:putative ATPase